MNMKSIILRAIAVATLAILPATAQAVPIVGSIDLTGAVRITPTSIDWLPAGGGVGFAVVDTATDYFVPLIGDIGQELDLDGVPVGVSLGDGLSGFQTFPFGAMPGLNFVLDMIVSCEQASIDPATQCDAGLDSAFRFDQDAFGTTVVMNFVGRVFDDANPSEIGNFIAKFDATFTGQTPEEILQAFIDNGEITTVYSARKLVVEQVQTVPEPATLLTFGAGTALLAAHRRRRAKKQQ